MDYHQSRIQSVDTVRSIAIFAVVAIHTMPFFDTYIWPGSDLDLGHLLNQLARFAVPFFFVISGYFWSLKTKTPYQIKTVTKKTSKKITIILLAWSAIYLLPTNLFNSFQNGTLGPIKTIYWNLSDLLAHPIRTAMEGGRVHLWFLVALLFCLAISATFISRNMKKSLIGLSIALYLTGLLGKAYADSPIGFHCDFNFRNGPFFGLIFFVTGYALGQLENKKHWLALGFFLAISGSLMHFAELFVLRLLWGTTMIQDYVIGTYFMGVGVALIALSNPQFLRVALLSKAGPLVLGIYAIHLVFVDLIGPIGAGLTGITWWELGYPAAVFTLSLASTYAMSRFRLTKQIVV